LVVTTLWYKTFYTTYTDNEYGIKNKGKETIFGKLIASQIFSIPTAYVSYIAYANLFRVATPFVVPLAVWLITSLYVIAKL
jgi:hypothetical protein